MNQSQTEYIKDEIDIAHQKKNELKTKKSEMEELIINIVNNVKSNKSSKSIECMQIYDMIYQLRPFIQNVDKSIEDVDDSKFIEFYNIFKRLFLNFQKKFNEASKQIEDTFQKNNQIDKEYIAKIKDEVNKMRFDLKKLQKGIFEQSKRYLLWLDYNIDGEENQTYLKQFQNLCNGIIQVKPFSDHNIFREFLQKNPDCIYYIVMSGKAAGDYPGDGENLKWLKAFISQNTNAQSVYGVIIFTYFGYPYFVPLKEKEKGFVIEVAQEVDTVMDTLQNIIFPKNNVRVIHVEQLECFLTYKKEAFMNLSQKDMSNEDITKYHPDKPFIIEGDKSSINKQLLQQYENKNLLERLKFVKKIVKEYQLKINEEYISLDIYDQLKACFGKNFSQAQISEKILTLYTEEGPFYNFINQTLGVLNEEILSSLWDLYVCLKIALNTYDDSLTSSIKYKGAQVKLFRGVNIPHAQFDSTYIVGKCILMCGFLSFSTKKEVAKQFATKNQSATEKNVIFKIKYNCGKSQLPNRPKFLKNISDSKHEDEYLFSLGTTFIIEKIETKGEFTHVYLIL